MRSGLWHKFAKGLVPGVRISKFLFPREWEVGGGVGGSGKGR